MPSGLYQTSLMPDCTISLIAKSLTLKAGERMAHCRAHPLAAASSAFRVVEQVLCKTSSIIVLHLGIRVDPPTISTASISSTENAEENTRFTI